jgi:hypothetical protein
MVFGGCLVVGWWNLPVLSGEERFVKKRAKAIRFGWLFSQGGWVCIK